MPGALVEIEHYHAAPPKTIPADEFCTRTAKTDPNGVVTGTLTDPGWWCLAAAADGGDEGTRRQELSGSATQHFLGLGR